MKPTLIIFFVLFYFLYRDALYPLVITHKIKLIITILFLGILTNTLVAQDYAEFRADTTSFKRWYAKDDRKLPEIITEQVWFINGQEMRYGSVPIMVKVNPNKLDTILYKGYRRKELDTIICNISEAKNYKFYYNECCGAFNIQDESTKKFIQGKIIYQLKNTDDKTYLGTLGEAGILVKYKKIDTLNVNCRSAMSPNVYNISFRQIEFCKDTLNCNEGICLQEKGKDNPNWNFGYKTVSIKLDILFIPLKSEPLIIIYDPKADTIEIE